MKRILVLIACAVATVIPSYAQELSVDKAMEAMKDSATQFLKGKYTKVDFSGIDQYVDATVTGVHNFSDFSFGNLMAEFSSYLGTRTSEIGGSRNMQAENVRMLEFAKQNPAKVAAYAAIVDYEGLTKFGETTRMSSVFFFDWSGNVIAVRPSGFNRDDYKPQLAACMEKKIRKELAVLKDPLFNKEKWISETVYNTVGDKMFEMKYCFILDKGESETNGPFKAFYYQVQTSGTQSKSISVITGRFEIKDGVVEFNYKKASVSTYLVTPDYVRSFKVDDFEDIPSNQLSMSIVNSTALTKAVRNSDSRPKVFEKKDNGHLIMTTPISEEKFDFTLVKE